MEEQHKIKKFSEVYPSGTQFEADKVEITEILNKELVIEDIAELTGDYGTFLVVLANLSTRLEGRQIQFATGSSVIMPKLKKAKQEGQLPLTAMIVQKKSEKTKRDYYDIE